MLHEPCLGNSIASAQGTVGQLPFFPDQLWNSAFDRAFAYLKSAEWAE